MITIFTPSFADEANTNAQNLTVKEVVSRLPADRFRVVMLGDGAPDPRILARENTEILAWSRHGNTARLLPRVLLSKIDVYFFPREGPLDRLFLFFRRSLRLPVALVTYIVMALDEIAVGPTMTRSICEADCVLGNSRYVSQTVKDRFGVATGTIYDGVKRELFCPPTEARRTASKLTVLYAGSFQARKRVDVVIREAANWPSVEFRLLGKGEEEQKCRSLVSELACRNVTFVGHLSQQGVADEMRNADVFLFPSVLEGHPQVLGQAASCGLPAVAMEKYRPDYVVHGETGYLVKSESELSQKLGLLLSDQDLRLRMSAAAARHALQFDWDKVARDWERVFVEAAGKWRRR
jgi:glycosyltransferase involved in cell wall biosynthesis